MGAKTGLMAYASENIGDVLRGRQAEPERAAAEALVRSLHPGWLVDADGVSRPVDNLLEATYPPEDVVYAASLPGVDILCDQRLMIDHPSLLPQRFLDAARGRTVVLHAMHSVVDWLAFAVWTDGALVRSLSISPDGGIQENIGEPLEFEAPFWAGAHPVERTPGWPNQDPYPLPFHPLDMGEEALRALFGFVVEGRSEPGDVDAFDIPVHGFRLVDPDGPTPEERKAQREALIAQSGPPRYFRMQPDGSMAEITGP